MISIAAIILLLVSLSFAWSMGAHYTGAVMGMPFASRAIAMWPALLLMAVLTVLGASTLSGGVQLTVGLRIVDPREISIVAAIVMVLSAAVLTTIYTYKKIPTSTIQILVFCVVGTGLAGHVAIDWLTILRLAILWVIAPIAAGGLGFVLTHLLDLVVEPSIAMAETQRLQDSGFAVAVTTAPSVVARILPALLVTVGCAASLTLGANDVANAVGVFSMVNLTTTTVAGFLGGLAMAVGALSWGQRILKRVAFDVVKTDLSMASAAQLVQAVVVLTAVSQGLFTSMNQALIGAMTGTGFARGRNTIQWPVIRGIVIGWAISPITGVAMSFALYTILQTFGFH